MKRASQWMEQIERGGCDLIFKEIYEPEETTLRRQRARYVSLIRTFLKIYGGGGDPEISIYSVPGRVEICGNHTDHNRGAVLAAAVNIDIVAVVAKSATRTIRMKSVDYPRENVVSLNALSPQTRERGKSTAMIRGIAAEFTRRGGRIGGYDCCTASEVMRGSGLSSSAAFEVCVAKILNDEYNDGAFSAQDLAMIGQRAENDYFGKPSGLMDQIAVAVGGVMGIDFEYPDAPKIEPMSFDLSHYGCRLVITDTGGSHAKLTDAYTAIRREMEAVAEHFGKCCLREVTPDLFLSGIAGARAACGDRAVLRAIHFFDENRRVRELGEAIRSEDIRQFLRIVVESGHSSFEYNQNAYIPGDAGAQGVSLGLALSGNILRGRGAWRLQGGGFAGTIQAFVPDELVDDYCALLTSVFGENACRVLSFRERGPLKF